MTTHELSKEHLAELAHNILSCHEVSPAVVKAMAVALLAGMEQEPVYFVEIEGDQDINAGRIEGKKRPDLGLLPDGINNLYAHPVISIPAAVPEFDFNDFMYGIRRSGPFRGETLADNLKDDAVTLIEEAFHTLPAQCENDPEPVAEIIEGYEYNAAGELIDQRAIDYLPSDIENLPVGTKLYAILPAAVPEEMQETPDDDPEIDAYNKGKTDGWNACRGAMLQSGSLTNADTMQPIYEYYPDNGWSECNSKEHYEELTELWCRARIVYVLTVNGNKNAQ